VKVLRVGGREVLRVRVDLSELNEVLTPAFVPSTILKNILEHYRSTFTLLGIVNFGSGGVAMHFDYIYVKDKVEKIGGCDYEECLVRILELVPRANAIVECDDGQEKAVALLRIKV